MTLEALGKSAADYKHPRADPADRQGVHRRTSTTRRADKVGTELAGLRLPDYVAMAAIAWQMGYKTGTDEAILAGGNDAFNAIPSADAIATLAARLRRSGDAGRTHARGTGQADRTPGAARRFRKDALEGGRQPGDRRDRRQNRTAEQRGANAAGSPPPRSSARSRSSATSRRCSTSSARQLDAGRQVVVGQYHHFVRLQAVTDEFVIKDDPGHYTGANEKATWEEARAMGLFLNWVVIG